MRVKRVVGGGGSGYVWGVRLKKKPASRYHHGDLRKTLLDAALDLIGRTGLAEVSLRAVAERAGVSSAAPYHHFADKKALLTALAEDGYAHLAAALSSSSPAPTAPIEARLRAMAHGYLAFAVAAPAHYRVMFLPELKDVASLHEKSIGTLLQFVALLREARPDLDEAGARGLAIVGWSALHGFALLSIDGLIVEKEGFPAWSALRDACVAHVTAMVQARATVGVVVAPAVPPSLP